jgi:hypothetical protein
MSIQDDLATLPVNAEFEVPTDQQQEALAPAPIPEGNYRLKVEKLSLDKNQDGTLKLSRDVWPTVVLEKVVVAEGEFEGRTAANFQRVYSVPFVRGGGTTPNASGLTDLLRAYDQTASFTSVGEIIEQLQRYVDEGATFRGQVRWSAFDKEAASAEYAKLGVTSKTASKEQHKAVKKIAEIKGMRKFPKAADGSYLATLKGPSGEVLEARSEINTFYGSNAEVKF